MKNILKAIIILPLILFLAIPVLAQNASPAANQAKEGEIRQRTIQPGIQEKTATRTARLTEQRREIIANHYQRMIRRFRASLERLEKIVQRIESRLEKIENKNEQLNLSSIKDDLEELKNSINEIGDNLIPQAENKFEEMNNGQNPGEVMPEIREAIKEIKDETIIIHQGLVKIIGNIKSLSEE